MNFEFKIIREKDYIIITLHGNLMDKSQAETLIESADELVKNNCCKWAIDLKELVYMNSSGLNTLIQLLTKARVGGGETVLYNMNKKINELILITKLNTLFKVSENKEDALNLLGV